MADVFVPGIKSRFDTEKIVDGLMTLERIPKTRAEEAVASLNTQKSYWQDVKLRLSALGESALKLFSFQNPFNERSALSSDPASLSASATREAIDGEYEFSVKEAAASDRFISLPLDSSYKAPAGKYTLKSGGEVVSFNFRGGAPSEFVEALNQKGGVVRARLVNVEKNAKSLLVESTKTGAEWKLGFEDAALQFALDIGLLQENPAPQKTEEPPEETAEETKAPTPPPPPEPRTIQIKPISTGVGEDALSPLTQSTASVASPHSRIEIPLTDRGEPIKVTKSMALKYDVQSTEPLPDRYAMNSLMLSAEESAAQNPAELSALTLVFDDGSEIALPAVKTGGAWQNAAIPLVREDGKTLRSVQVNNTDGSRSVGIRNIEIFEAPVPQDNDAAQNPQTAQNSQNAPRPAVAGSNNEDEWTPYIPRQAVSRARDAVIEMDGIEIRRADNKIDDLVPGVELNVQAASYAPVHITVSPDRESAKEDIIAFVGNYNRFMAELNVLTRREEAIITELNYLSKDEQDELRKKLGAFSGDSTLQGLRSTMQRLFTSPYTLNDGRTMLAQEIGIGTNVQRRTTDQSKLRGYMEIDEKTLDAALASRITDIQKMFGLDTDGDLQVDSGLAFSVNRLARPYTEMGGLINSKTQSIDASVAAQTRRIETMDRQLASKEQQLKNQYGAVEGAFNQMERMSNSLENFSNSNSNGNR